LDHDIGGRFDFNITVAFNQYFFSYRVQDNFIFLGLVYDDNFFSTFFIVEDNAMARPRFYKFGVVLTGSVIFNRLLFFVSHPSKYDWSLDIAMLKHHQHLIINFWQEIHPTFIATHWRGNPRPKRFVCFRKPRQFDSDCVLRRPFVFNHHSHM
jgi:hypothetical protein